MSEEICVSCGVDVGSWSAPHDQWNAVTEHPDSDIPQGRGAILCAGCFVLRAGLHYGPGIVMRVELWQSSCTAHGYWPPCPESSGYDPCRWELKRADFTRRFEGSK